ncbi:MFS transporter [Streptomyces sp. UNOC14_S4]|uniref:MFS transporter n=1 Tax=Streptomyces sp. UNOC14_S4 TaxID=2872340 RepID=UPI001E373314|nr:MFS transporter [Streptomyces sp. UNOC14_S4]MCC3771138.1 MFS transporter [Streptomyces sp. UNOC14_S4]
MAAVGGYGDLLRTRHAARLLTGTLVGRLPNATAALAIVLFVRAEGSSFALASALSAVYGAANALGQPLLGRAVDLYGQPRVMLPSAVLAALGMTVFAVLGVDALLPAYVAMVVAGFFTPPLEGGLRALWPSVLGDEGRIHAAYSLDAIAQEVIYVVGPLIITGFVAVWSPAGALFVINLLGVLGALAVVTSPPSRKWRSEPREAHWLGALRSRGLLVVLGAFFFIGCALGSIALTAVAYADRHGGDAVSGYLLSAVGVGALIGGTIYGAREWPGSPEQRLRVLVAGLAVCYVPLLLAPGVVLMTVLAGVAGIFLAPSLACAFVVVDRHALRGTVTEAFSWLVTSFGVGASIGTAAAGPAVEHSGVVAGFGVAVGVGFAALLVLVLAQRALRAPEAPSTVVARSENDRNGAVEPGFSTGVQA